MYEKQFFGPFFLLIFSIFLFFRPVLCLNQDSTGFFRHIYLRQGYAKKVSSGLCIFNGILYAQEDNFLFSYNGKYLKDGSSKLWPLKTGRINDLDSGQYLWIAHEKGLISFNGKKGTDYVSAPGFKGKRAFLVSAAKGGITAVVTDRAVLKGYYFNRQYVFEDLGFPEKFFNPSSFFDLYSGNSGIWIGTSSGLFYLENRKNAFWQRFTTNQGLPASRIFTVTEDSLNRVWAGGYDIFGGGTAVYHNKIWTRPFKKYDNRPQRPVAAAVYNNILWICSEKGISRFDGYNISNYGPDEGLEGSNMSALAAGPDFVAARFSDKIVSIINILDFNRN